MIKKLFVCLTAICLSALMVACREDSRVAGPEDGSSPDWPARSLKEDCVDMLVLSLVRGDAGRYGELLLKPDTTGTFPEGFIWYNNHNLTEEKLPPLLHYEQDLEAVELLMAHAVDFEFKVDPGSWYSRNSFRGIECSDCWESTRGYILHVMLDNGETYTGMFFRLKLIIGPDPEEAGKYVIYEAADLPRGQMSAARQPADVEGISLGMLKSIVMENL